MLPHMGLDIAPGFLNQVLQQLFPHYGNDVEEEMIRASIEASKQEAGLSSQVGTLL